MNAQPVRWTLPEWAAELILETLRTDVASPAFDPDLRHQLSAAIQSINQTGLVCNTIKMDSGFDLFRLSKGKEIVDVCPNTLRAYNKQGLPFYHRGKAIFISKAELALFIMYAPYRPGEAQDQEA
jgi:hypothetical protein